MSEAEEQIPRSDLPTRVIAGVVMIVVALVATLLGGWPLRILVGAAAALMLIEWGDMHRTPRGWSYSGAALLTALLLTGSEYLFPLAAAPSTLEPGALSANWLGFAAIASAALAAGLASRHLRLAAGMLYVGVPGLAMLSLSWTSTPLVLWVLAVTWATDILAYFAGRSIGGPKLAPRISPNKTWAGLAGGVAGAALFGWLAAAGFGLQPLFLWIGGAMGLIAQTGDLFESWLKRRAGVKDSGAILPGHGGLLDRLDGLLAVALASTLLLMASA